MNAYSFGGHTLSGQVVTIGKRVYPIHQTVRGLVIYGTFTAAERKHLQMVYGVQTMETPPSDTNRPSRLTHRP